MSRLELSDTGMDVIGKMAEGNPGAISAMMNILEKHESIDPQSMMGGLGALMILDTWEIYGTDIYVLWSDKCNRDVRQMLMIMRATQLGLFPSSKLKEMAGDQSRQIDLTDEEWTDLDEKVCEQLERFARP